MKQTKEQEKRKSVELRKQRILKQEAQNQALKDLKG